MLTINVALIFLFFRYLPDFAIFGPAVGYVTGNVVQTLYYGWRIENFYNVSLGQLLKWRSLALIGVCTLIACVPLLAGEFVSLNEFVRVPTFSILFAAVYFVAIRYVRLEEVETVIEAVTARLRRNA